MERSWRGCVGIDGCVQKQHVSYFVLEENGNVGCKPSGIQDFLEKKERAAGLKLERGFLRVGRFGNSGSNPAIVYHKLGAERCCLKCSCIYELAVFQAFKSNMLGESESTWKALEKIFAADRLAGVVRVFGMEGSR